MAEIRSPIISVYNVSDGKDGKPSIEYKLVVDHQVHIGAQMAADDYIEVQLLQSLGTETVLVAELNSTYLKASYADTTLNDDLVFIFSGNKAQLTCKKNTDAEGNTVGTWHNSDIIISAYVNQVNVDTERVGYSSSTPIVEFDNDHGSLHYKSNGIDKVYPDESATTTATLYVNGQAVESGVGWTWNVLKHDGEKDSCTITLLTGNQCTVTAISPTAFKGQVNCIASYAGEKYSRIFEVSRNLQGKPGDPGTSPTVYSLLIDRQVHTGLAMGTNKTIKVQVRAITADSTTMMQLTPANIVIEAKYQNKADALEVIKPTNNDTDKTIATITTNSQPWQNDDIMISLKIDELLIDQERISYSGDTPILELTNDVATLLYDSTGMQQIIENQKAQTTAKLYVRGQAIKTTIKWVINDDPNFLPNDDIQISGENKETLAVMAIAANDVLFATAFAEWGDMEYSKIFTVYKLCQGKDGEKGETGAASDITQKYIYLYYKLETIQGKITEGTWSAPSTPNSIDDIVEKLDTTQGQWAYSMIDWSSNEAKRTNGIVYRSIMTSVTKGTNTPTYTYSTPELYEAYDSKGVLGSESYLAYLSITNFDNSDSFGYKNGNLYIKSTFINTDGIIVNNAANKLLFAAGGNSDYKNAVKIGGFMVTETALRNVTGSTGNLGGMNSPTDSLMYAGSEGGGPGLPNTDYIYVGADGIGLIHTSTTYATGSSNYYATAQTYLKSGKLFSNSAEITGTITATGGAIGGLTLNNTSLYNIISRNGREYYLTSTETLNTTEYVDPSIVGENLVYFGPDGFGVTTISTSGIPIKLSRGNYVQISNGTLKANNVELSDKITATNIQIKNMLQAGTGKFTSLLVDNVTVSDTCYVSSLQLIEEGGATDSAIIGMSPIVLGATSKTTCQFTYTVNTDSLVSGSSGTITITVSSGAAVPEATTITVHTGCFKRDGTDEEYIAEVTIPKNSKSATRNLSISWPYFVVESYQYCTPTSQTYLVTNDSNSMKRMRELVGYTAITGMGLLFENATTKNNTPFQSNLKVGYDALTKPGLLACGDMHIGGIKEADRLLNSAIDVSMQYNSASLQVNASTYSNGSIQYGGGELKGAWKMEKILDSGSEFLYGPRSTSSTRYYWLGMRPDYINFYAATSSTFPGVGNQVGQIGATISSSLIGNKPALELSGNLIITGATRFTNTVTNSGGSTVFTSSRQAKTDIQTFTSQHNCFFDALLPKQFKYKNGTSGRLHYGFILDEVQTALTQANLTTQECAAYCLENINDPNGDGGLRYGEFISLNTWQIQLLKPRVSELEVRCDQFEARIKQLEEQNEKI